MTSNQGEPVTFAKKLKMTSYFQPAIPNSPTAMRMRLPYPIFSQFQKELPGLTLLTNTGPFGVIPGGLEVVFGAGVMGASTEGWGSQGMHPAGRKTRQGSTIRPQYWQLSTSGIRNSRQIVEFDVFAAKPEVKMTARPRRTK